MYVYVCDSNIHMHIYVQALTRHTYNYTLVLIKYNIYIYAIVYSRVLNVMCVSCIYDSNERKLYYIWIKQIILIKYLIPCMITTFILVINYNKNCN